MSNKDRKTLINAIKVLLKKDPIVGQMFGRYKMDPSFIDDMPVDFADLDVSAKTKDGKVIISDKLLEDGDFNDDIHYIVHEACHWLQQTTGEADKHKKKGKTYLDLPTELEAFYFQTKFMSEFYGPEDSDKYIEDLLDFHEYSGDERKKKKEQILNGE